MLAEVLWKTGLNARLKVEALLKALRSMKQKAKF